MAELLQLYWPKLISAAWFAGLNLIFLAFYGKDKRYIAERFVKCFIVSPSFVSIIGEQIVIRLYQVIRLDFGISDPYNAVFIIINMVFDATFIVIGGMFFRHFIGMDKYLGATIYMQYVCIERLTLVVAISYPGYILWYAIFQLTVFVTLRKEMNFVFQSTSVKWKNVFLYLVGLFYILDLLYAAYFLFPELGTDVLNVQNIFWLDSVAMLSSLFALGYEKIAINVAKQYDKKHEYYEKLQSSQENIIIKLTEISEAKSGETGQHVRRVAEYSKLLARTMKLNDDEVEHIKIAAMMHDLGKLLISHDIIEKKGELTDEEYEIMKGHAQYGWDILANSEGEIIEMARIIALEHHERWDGKGYPQGLMKNEISIYAQIVSVADVFDALTSERAYKKAWDVETAKKEIIQQRGEQFSPTVVDAFVSCFDEIKEIKAKYVD